MTLQGFFDARLERKTDAVTGRISKFAAENNRLWMTDFERQIADSFGAFPTSTIHTLFALRLIPPPVPVGLPDRKFALADRPWAPATRISQSSSAAAAVSPSSSSPEWRLPAPPPHARTSPLKRMIDVGVFEPTAAPPCPKNMSAKFKSNASLSEFQLKQWKHLTSSSSYGGLIGIAEDASKLGHIRRRVPELGGA
jgi:hypothetical protein